eukprot:jgi/Botrbrau1/16214/Bobra.0066s0002.2
MALDGELNDVPVRPKGPRPHRCNDRIEDLLEAILTLDFGGKIRPAWKVLRLCLNSAPGSEPTEKNFPYQIITDGKQFLEPRRRPVPRDRH